MVFLKSNFDGDVHAGGQIEFLQFVHGLGGRVEDVNQPLVSALLESFLRFFVRVRRALHGEALDAGRQRDGAGDAGAGAFDGVRDFARGLVYDAMVIGLQSDSYSLCSHRKNNFIVMVVLNFFRLNFQSGREIYQLRLLTQSIFETKLRPCRWFLGSRVHDRGQHAVRNLRERQRFHGIRCAAFRQRTDRRCVTEHFREWHLCVQDGLAVLRLDAVDDAATTVDVTEQIALIFIGRGAFDFHDRFEQNRTGLFEGVFERENSSHAEREFVRVNFVERAVNDFDFDVNDLIAGINTAFYGFLDAADDRRNIFLRNRAADNLVKDLDALAFFIRLDGDAGVAVLTFAAGLTDEFSFALGFFGDRFAISDLRGAGVGLHFEFALEAINDDFQMQLAHARDDKLAGFLVRETAERRVFLGETLQAFGQFVAILFRLRLHGHRDDGFWKRRRFERYVVIFIAKRVAGRDVAQTDERSDVAGINFVDVLAFAALDDHEAADALAFARARIVNRIALFQLTGINAEENQLT